MMKSHLFHTPRSLSFSALLTLGISGSLTAQEVINGNLQVSGSAGIGRDASGIPDFGLNTMTLAENNLRIGFLDTSNSASFPGNDWVLGANDSANGGRNSFFISDDSAKRNLFTILAGAPKDSFFMNRAGAIGLGTDAPQASLHLSTGDSPGIRFDQTGAAGPAAQAWDLGGNEANFFLRDVTNNAAIPFKVKPASASNSLVLAAQGVGVGTDNPQYQLHVRESDAAQTALIENTNAASAARTLLQLSNDGAAGLRVSNVTTAGTASDWDVTAADDGSLTLQRAGSSAVYTFSGDGSLSVDAGGSTLLSLDSSGNLTAAGTVNGTSDVNRKENFGAVNASDLLDKVSRIPVQTWSYLGEDITHIGPMAQDFHAAFAVGGSERHISMADADGVALASIQALHAESKAKDKKIDSLEKRLVALEALLSTAAE